MPTVAEFVRQHPGKSAKEVMILAKKEGVKIPDINRIYAVRYNERQLLGEKPVKRTKKVVKKAKKVRAGPVKRRPKRKVKAVSADMTPEIEALCLEIVELVKKQVFAKLDWVRQQVSDGIAGRGL